MALDFNQCVECWEHNKVVFLVPIGNVGDSNSFKLWKEHTKVYPNHFYFKTVRFEPPPEFVGERYPERDQDYNRE